MTNTKPEQERISTLLLDTVTLLCRNGLTFKNKLTVQGLIGITIDDSEVFIVHINENTGTVGEQSNNCNEEHSKAPVQAGKTVINTQFPTCGDTTTKPNTRVEKVHSNSNASKVTYNRSISELSSENGDVINIKSEEEEMESSFKQSISHCSQTSLSDDLLFQQMLSTNYSTYQKQEMNESEGRTDEGTLETVQQKMEPNYDFDITCNYQTISSNYGQVFKDFDAGNQLDYQAIGEGYAEDEEVNEDDVKPDANIQLESYSSWEQQHMQPGSSHNHLSNRRSVMYSLKRANRRLKTNASSTRFSQCGFAGSGQRFPHHRHLVTNEFFPQKTAESSALNEDGTIKTMMTFICNIDGCTNSFTLKSNLLRHQTNKHGRSKRPRRTIKDMASGYEQYDVTEDD